MASERLVALQAEIEAKQREVERIIAEEAKKNSVPPLINALEVMRGVMWPAPASAEAASAAEAADKLLTALLNQAREDAETKRANADMFESMRAQMAALQARVTTLEEEKAAKARLAEETIRSLGYSTGY